MRLVGPLLRRVEEEMVRIQSRKDGEPELYQPSGLWEGD